MAIVRRTRHQLLAGPYWSGWTGTRQFTNQLLLQTILPLLRRSTRDGCKDRLNDGYTNDSLGGISRARCALLAKKGGMCEGRYYDHCVSILTHKYIVCCSSQDSFMVMDTTEDVNPGWNCNSTQLPSYSSTLAIPFSLSSSYLNHACSMHSVHFLPYLNLERSIFVGLPPIVSMWGRHRTHLWSNGPLYRSSPMFQSQTHSIPGPLLAQQRRLSGSLQAAQHDVWGGVPLVTMRCASTHP